MSDETDTLDDALSNLMQASRSRGADDNETTLYEESVALIGVMKLFPGYAHLTQPAARLRMVSKEQEVFLDFYAKVMNHPTGEPV